MEQYEEDENGNYVLTEEEIEIASVTDPVIEQILKEDKDKRPGRPSKDPVFDIEIDGQVHQAVNKLVASSGHSGRVYLPVEWIGKRCLVVLLED